MKKAMVFIKGTNGETQYNACKEYAAESGLTVIDTTTSFDIVGDSASNGEIDVVLVYEWSKVTQSAIEYRQIVNQFEGLGVKLLSVN